MTIML